MRNPSSRRGSALLIVLGMLSFMIVSAVGFATYMRYSRMPSSFLRRANSSRLIVKAAVAEAMEQIDKAVCNNYHPNIGFKYVDDGRQPGSYSGGDMNNVLWNGSSSYPNLHNVWRHRVFMKSAKPDVLNRTTTDSSTVTPLCLEALAYIPPPLINDVRFYSRITPTAKWQPFGFDVGRYSFVAVDVSDYFDLNRILADAPRASSATRRVTLSYLFEENGHKTPPSSVAEWDGFMDKFRKYNEKTGAIEFNGKYPLISVADFNLALGNHGGVWKGNFSSPFCDYISGRTESLYPGNKSIAGNYKSLQGGTLDAYLERFRRMTFVTDSLLPVDLTEAEESSGGGRNQQQARVQNRFPLSDPKNQPFKMSDLKNKGGRSMDLATLIRGANSAFGHLDDKLKRGVLSLSTLGCAILYDYLDEDHIPISLAVPTFERTPMICGIEPKFENSQFRIQKTMIPAGENDVDTKSENETSRIVRKTVRYTLDPRIVEGFMGGTLNTLVVFPFSHKDEDDGQFALDGRFALFFSSDKMSLRTSPSDILHLEEGDIEEKPLMDNGLINAKLDNLNISNIKTTFVDNKRQEDALQLHKMRLRRGSAAGQALAMGGNALLEVTYEWEQTKSGGNAGGMIANQGWAPEWKDLDKNKADYIVEAKCFPIVDAGGKLDQDLANFNNLKGVITGGGKEITMNAGAWLRIKDSSANGKVVDMVPACILDDKNQNGFGMDDATGAVLLERLGAAYPLMRFDTGISFTLSINALDSIADKPQPVTISPAAAMVADPRYNYAPEHWFQVAAGIDKNTWLTNNKVGDGDRDGDISMATSDAGYLQSKYEFAHIPRLTGLLDSGDGNRDNDMTGNLKCPSVAYGGKSLPDSFGATANQEFMWRTYDPTDIDEQAFEKLPWTSEDTGFKVNPYTDSMNIMMAAFANTPIDWKRSSTNHTFGTVKYAEMKAANFNRDYAFNQYSKDTKISWEFLETAASRFYNSVRDRAGENKDWVEAWQQLDWSYHNDKFLGIDLDADTDNLFVADRKFLYGYWRECFAAKQQLFLIFARAEPMMMGGGAAGQIPPQLGARAVALVWRDPTATPDIGGKYVPHQMRVLFYRQFE
ncbi:MAG: hypothetical protein IJI54_16090 [Kiritimatiellae bacterium]|nr:hypothetical protein [Kiritimatiellia bacterium]